MSTNPRPPPLAGTPKEAIKDTSPANAVDPASDEEIAEAEEEGKISEMATKTKHRTKAAISHLFQKTGKKMAGFRGDVAIDGERAKVSILGSALRTSAYSSRFPRR